MVLLRAGTFEKIVVWEGLETGSLADCEAAALGRIVVDIVMAVSADVGDDGCGDAA
jgi:hypothetical protein